MLSPAVTPPPRPRFRGKRVLAISVLLVVALVIPTVVVPTVFFPPKPPAFTDDVALPEFTLVDHTGAPYTRAALAGRVTIVNFIFTRCDTVCPVTSMKMRTIMDRTGDQPLIQLLSISVDPEHDTVPVLAAYAAQHGADPARWRFVRGDEKPVRALVEQAMKIGFDRIGTTPRGTPDIVHQPHFVLIDARGHLRGYYDSDDWGRMETLMRHARWLAHHRS